VWNDPDEQLIRFRDKKGFDELYPGHEPILFQVHGIQQRGAFIYREGQAEFRGRSEIEQEQATMRLEDFFARFVDSGGGETAQCYIRIDPNLVYSANLVEASLFKAAYLAAFSCLGYPYILSPALRRIREQLRDPAQFSLPNAVLPVESEADMEARIQVTYVCEPKEIRSLGIVFSGIEFPTGWIAFLPLPVNPTLPDYEAIREILQEPSRLRLLGLDCIALSITHTSLILVNEDGEKFLIYPL